MDRIALWLRSEAGGTMSPGCSVGKAACADQHGEGLPACAQAMPLIDGRRVGRAGHGEGSGLALEAGKQSAGA